jgi:hypothetical protein
LEREDIEEIIRKVCRTALQIASARVDVGNEEKNLVQPCCKSYCLQPLTKRKIDPTCRSICVVSNKLVHTVCSLSPDRPHLQVHTVCSLSPDNVLVLLLLLRVGSILIYMRGCKSDCLQAAPNFFPVMKLQCPK